LQSSSRRFGGSLIIEKTDRQKTVEQPKDGAMGNGLIGAHYDGAGLNYQTYRVSDELVFIIPKKHAAGSKRKVNLDYMREHSFISREPSSGTGQPTNNP
jgi:hypothetical protein